MLKRYHAKAGGARGRGGGKAKPGFELLAAIDLRAGRVVRLTEGDFDRETAYSGDPVATAAGFVAAGARWLHIVDLDGARAGEPRQSAAIGDVVREIGRQASCQVAGGLRSAAAVGEALAAGAGRVVLGTAALRDPGFAARLVERHGPERVAVGLDIREGVAVGDAWRRGASGTPAGEAFLALAAAGVETFVVTAIARDGRLEGPDLELLASLAGLEGRRVIASGGIGSIDDLRAVHDLGCAGAIVGKALYEGRLDLAEAVRTADGWA